MRAGETIVFLLAEMEAQPAGRTEPKCASRKRSTRRAWMWMINGHVRGEITRRPHDPDPDAIAATLHRATGITLDAWAARMGYADWVRLFCDLPSVKNVVWKGDDVGWCIIARPSNHGRLDRARGKRNPPTSVVTAPNRVSEKAPTLRDSIADAKRASVAETAAPAKISTLGRLDVKPTEQRSGENRLPLPRGVEAAALPMDPMDNVVVVTTLVACCMATADLARHPVLGLDCEGINAHPRSHGMGMGLVQIAGPTGPCYLFDLCAMPGLGNAMFARGGLGRIMEDARIVKVVHDARGDARALERCYGVVLCNVFDTQVHDKRVRSLNQGPSLVSSLHAYGLPTNPYKSP